jgi:deferrochelatase/peroxidase EfeB
LNRINVMDNIEWDDIQGLVLSGYPQLPYSAYVIWRFRPRQQAAARTWLADLAGRLMRADSPRGGTHHKIDSNGAIPNDIQALKAAKGTDLRAVNLALTSSGLRKLEIDERRLSGFALEFTEGMAPKPYNGDIPRRSNLLGDAGDSSPERWWWGGWKDDDVDGMLMLYADEEGPLQALVDAEIAAMAEACELVVSSADDSSAPVVIKGRIYDDRKEHFGFTDGISQPTIEGSPVAKRSRARLKQKASAPHGEDGGKVLSAKEQRISLVKPGEFILGYPNERRESITSDSAKAGANVRDLLRNGTYLVFRQLEQDVHGFDEFVSDLAVRLHGEATPETTEDVAARIIGRTRCGEPLVPRAADSRKHGDRNDFLYSYEDTSGMACPVGAHIRRANPRDVIGPDPDTALRLSKMHRIIRRGRPYGPRLEPGEAKPNGNGSGRGIAFIALNADIAGQYEMIQHSWLNNRHFGGLQIGTDPIGHVAQTEDEFAVQRRPANLHMQRARPLVTVRGGAYFFMPGINAVRALAD